MASWANREAGPAGRPLGYQQRPVHQPGDQAFGLARRLGHQGGGQPGGHRARDHGHRRVQLLFPGVQQADAAVDGHPHALVPAPAAADPGQ